MFHFDMLYKVLFRTRPHMIVKIDYQGYEPSNIVTQILNKVNKQLNRAHTDSTCYSFKKCVQTGWLCHALFARCSARDTCRATSKKSSVNSSSKMLTAHKNYLKELARIVPIQKPRSQCPLTL